MTEDRVALVDERDADTRYSVDAYLENGDLKIDGQDLGPGTKPFSSDGEYEWIVTVKAESLAAAVLALGGREGEPILELLAREWSGRRAYAIRRTLDAAGVPNELFVWSG